MVGHRLGRDVPLSIQATLGRRSGPPEPSYLPDFYVSALSVDVTGDDIVFEECVNSEAQLAQVLRKPRNCRLRSYSAENYRLLKSPLNRV